MTLVSSGALLASQELKTYVVTAVNTVCEDNLDDIEAFFNEVVDKPMCSDMCPCNDEQFVLFTAEISTSRLVDFER